MRLTDFLLELKIERLALERVVADFEDVLGLTQRQAANTLRQTTPQSTPDFTHLDCYRFCHEKLCSENELTNNRLSWNFTIQGFLYAAYALTLQSIANVKIKLADTQLNDKYRPDLEQAVRMLNHILKWIPWTGILVSGCIGMGALAAQIAIWSIRRHFYQEHPDHKRQKWTTHGKHFPGVTGGGNEAAHWLGTVPLLIPILFVIMWAVALRYPFN